jgi:hypothetical protein
MVLLKESCLLMETGAAATPKKQNSLKGREAETKSQMAIPVIVIFLFWQGRTVERF